MSAVTLQVTEWLQSTCTSLSPFVWTLATVKRFANSRPVRSNWSRLTAHV